MPSLHRMPWSITAPPSKQFPQCALDTAWCREPSGSAGGTRASPCARGGRGAQSVTVRQSGEVLARKYLLRTVARIQSVHVRRCIGEVSIQAGNQKVIIWVGGRCSWRLPSSSPSRRTRHRLPVPVGRPVESPGCTRACAARPTRQHPVPAPSERLRPPGPTTTSWRWKREQRGHSTYSRLCSLISSLVRREQSAVYILTRVGGVVARRR
jgi:hypothetical protein